MTAPNAPLPLPGLEDTSGRAVTYLEKAVRRTLAALADGDALPESKAAHAAMAITLAEIIELKKASGRMSTIGNDVRAMVELLEKLVPDEGEVDAGLAAAMEAWSAVHNGAPS